MSADAARWVRLLYEEHLYRLNDWEQGFVGDLYHHLDDDEELTTVQHDKVRQIAQQVGVL